MIFGLFVHGWILVEPVSVAGFGKGGPAQLGCHALGNVPKQERREDCLGDRCLRSSAWSRKRRRSVPYRFCEGHFVLHCHSVRVRVV